MPRYFKNDQKGLRVRNSPMCTLSQNGYGDRAMGLVSQVLHFFRAARRVGLLSVEERTRTRTLPLETERERAPASAREELGGGAASWRSTCAQRLRRPSPPHLVIALGLLGVSNLLLPLEGLGDGV